ncbi:MAG: orotate phosphoribosyltransferase [Dehalococcoidia bacterium]
MDRRALIQLLAEAEVVRTGNFTLKSGATSPVYIDLRRLVGYPNVLREVASAYADRASKLKFDVLAALPYAALPIGTALSLDMERPLVYPRKERKDYGTAKQVEGVFEEGQRALVIDDVITDGGAKLEGIEALEGAGLVVQDILVLVDREAGGRETLAERGYRLHTILTLAEILDAMGVAAGQPAS